MAKGGLLPEEHFNQIIILDEFLLEGNKQRSSEFEKTTSSKPKPKTKSVADEGQKIKIAALIKQYPCLWNKVDANFRNQRKREIAWTKIAKEMEIEVKEAKAMWKKVKDSNRYLIKKTRGKAKSGDAAHDVDEEDDEVNVAENQELAEQLSFLNENFSFGMRSTVSLGGGSVIPQPATTSMDSPEDSTSFVYKYMTNKRKREEDTTVAAAHLFIESITSLVEKRSEKQTELKHLHSWLHLESMFGKLDDGKVDDLIFNFISQTYKAVVDKRST